MTLVLLDGSEGFFWDFLRDAVGFFDFQILLGYFDGILDFYGIFMGFLDCFIDSTGFFEVSMDF